MCPRVPCGHVLAGVGLQPVGFPDDLWGGRGRGTGTFVSNML